MAVLHKRSLHGERPLLREIEQAASTTLLAGALAIVKTIAAAAGDGKLIAHNSQTVAPEWVVNSDSTAGATDGKKAEVMPIGKGILEWVFSIVPKVLDVVALSGSNTTTIKVPYPDVISADTLIGGKVYCNGQQRTITDNDAVASGGDTVTLTVSEPFDQTTLGKAVRVTSLGLHVKAGKLVSSTFDVPSQTIADLTGGCFRVTEVDLKDKTVTGVFV